MQPRIIDPRSASQRLAQAAANTVPSNPRNEHSNEKSFVQPTDRLQGQFHSNPYGSSTVTSEQTIDGNTSRDDFVDENDDTEVHFNHRKEIKLLQSCFSRIVTHTCSWNCLNFDRTCDRNEQIIVSYRDASLHVQRSSCKFHFR